MRKDKVTVRNPRHDCPVFGKNSPVPRAYNTAMPGKFFFKCPMCGYKAPIEPQEDENL